MKLKRWINIPIELDIKTIASAIRQKQVRINIGIVEDLVFNEVVELKVGERPNS